MRHHIILEIYTDISEKLSVSIFIVEDVRSEVLTTVIIFVWNVTLCCLVDVYRSFGGTFCLNLLCRTDILKM
jgi:hypothetical protein